MQRSSTSTSDLTRMKMKSPSAWRNSSWIPQEEATLALDDRGLLQGAMIVDRLRTCNGRLLDPELHVARFQAGCSAAGIQLPQDLSLQAILEECVSNNLDHFSGRDFSIVSLATPGRASDPSNTPTLIVHAAGIDWRKLSAWYRQGQPLMVASPQNVPQACWPPSLKTRSRMHYYLAEREVSASAEENTGAVLLNAQGCITDTSIANLLIVQDSVLICPPLNSVLNGICLIRSLQMAKQAGIEVAYEAIDVDRALMADEILLCGSTGIFWAAASLIGPSQRRVFENPTQGRIFQKIRGLWLDAIGVDFEHQARLNSAN